MDRIEDIARKLCAADGIDPDWRKPISYPSAVGSEGVGSNKTFAKTVMVDALAPPAWENYKHAARAIVDA